VVALGLSADPRVGVCCELNARMPCSAHVRAADRPSDAQRERSIAQVHRLNLHATGKVHPGSPTAPFLAQAGLIDLFAGAPAVQQLRGHDGQVRARAGQLHQVMQGELGISWRMHDQSRPAAGCPVSPPPTSLHAARPQAKGSDLRVHFKNSREAAMALKGRELTKAKKYLEDVIDHKRAIPFRRFCGGVGRTAQVLPPPAVPSEAMPEAPVAALQTPRRLRLVQQAVFDGRAHAAQRRTSSAWPHAPYSLLLAAVHGVHLASIYLLPAPNVQ